jgi:pimeloyl-ACP methyl ester carboxylesterase
MNSITLRLLGSAAWTFDLALIAAFKVQSRRSAPSRAAEALSHEERLERLSLVREAYCSPELLSDPDAYFGRPQQVVPRARHVRDLPWGGACMELSWESTFEPHHHEMRDAYLANPHNRRAYARIYGRGGARPVAILVHGYMTGQWAIEERAWPIRWMNAHGLDVAVPVLPFHGVRARPEGGPPPFPGSDPRWNNEGFGQSVVDLRTLVTLLRLRGATSVGLMGMSLGGYATALLATVERDLGFAVPIIPLASLADYAREQGRLGAGARAAAQHAALEAANQVISPMARRSLVPSERVLVIGAVADRVTPIGHAERLAAHFGAPLLRLHGGHLLQTWRRQAFRAVKGMLRKNGVV